MKKNMFDNYILKEYCEKNNISKLSLFGSSLKDYSTINSDYDLLVEFKGGKKPGLLNFVRIKRELSEILGKKVDLRTTDELSKYFRNNVVREAEIKYESE